MGFSKLALVEYAHVHALWSIDHFGRQQPCEVNNASGRETNIEVLA